MTIPQGSFDTRLMALPGMGVAACAAAGSAGVPYANRDGMCACGSLQPRERASFAELSSAFSR